MLILKITLLVLAIAFSISWYFLSHFGEDKISFIVYALFGIYFMLKELEEK